VKGFEVLPKRWIVEKTFGWLIQSRRQIRDHQVRSERSEALIFRSMTGGHALGNRSASTFQTASQAGDGLLDEHHPGPVRSVSNGSGEKVAREGTAAMALLELSAASPWCSSCGPRIY
jgi:hypothetical protein